MNRATRLSTWARLGYLARGIVYLVIGWLALDSNRPLSAGDAIKSVEDMPMGTALLAVLALGLFGYGLYKVIFALADFDGDGTEPKGLVKRGARFVGGLLYWGLAFVAGKALLDDGSKGGEQGQAAGSGGASQDAANQAVEATGTDAILLIAALVVLGAGATQLYIAAKAKFMDEMAGNAPPLVKPAGQVGYAARGLVVMMVGWFALKAGLGGERLRGFGDALAVVRDEQPLLFKLIAIGLILFGLVSLAMARYRMIHEKDLTDVHLPTRNAR